ncbi:mandelate racemase/muconate lactonizing enzyme family protein [Halarchaeum acidiphilum]|uniref:mandelate racemase/muconate lactonizing enzyme family protein n=1 Tax=Halarchaeum acidiphilum TaxID=489138 RepID=UPI00036AEEAF|nr:mandelate racemase/muconate lactonizing enzyme family protein [Halarchaeum acidiphilum]
MQITDIEVIPLSYRLPEGCGLGDARGFGYDRETTLIRLDTDAGHIGWGEAFVPGRLARATIESFFADEIVGFDPHDVESLADRFTTDPYHFGRGIAVQSALSAVDIACWDLIGKDLDHPVYRLLGGVEREELRPYASTMYFTEQDRSLAEPIERAVSEGFTAAKIKIGGGTESDVKRVRVAREVLGDDALLMVDMNGNYRPAQAARTANAIAEYDIAWIEEPVPPENESGYQEVKRRVDVPIAAGEAHYGRFAFKRLIDDYGVDIVQPNLARCGGLTEARRIGTIATTENVRICPHVWNSAVGLAAAVQFAASTSEYPHTRNRPEPRLLEFDRSENPLRSELLEDPLDPTGGVLKVPQKPGLGIDVDEVAVERYRDD